jgi:hypothetical protein
VKNTTRIVSQYFNNQSLRFVIFIHKGRVRQHWRSQIPLIIHTLPFEIGKRLYSSHLSSVTRHNKSGFSLITVVISLEQTHLLNRGQQYIQFVQGLAPTPVAIDVLDHTRDRDPICLWIGQHIDAINRDLQLHLNQCHGCFDISDRPSVQILAVPLPDCLGLDGLCNLTTQPITILVDIGRLHHEEWLALIAHEYAHACLGQAGHDQRFAAVLSHLCIGLGLEPPSKQGDLAYLAAWPPYTRTLDPLAFWRGEIG